MQEQARTGGARLALPGETHASDHTIDDPVVICVRIDDGLVLPPSSSDTGTMRSAAARMISLPTSVDPVER